MTKSAWVYERSAAASLLRCVRLSQVAQIRPSENFTQEDDDAPPLLDDAAAGGDGSAAADKVSKMKPLIDTMKANCVGGVAH